MNYESIKENLIQIQRAAAQLDGLLADLAQEANVLSSGGRNALEQCIGINLNILREANDGHKEISSRILIPP